jgi:hypothetical protein
MLMPEQVLVYADCAINPDPSAEQLAEIAKQSADSAAAFGIDAQGRDDQLQHRRIRQRRRRREGPPGDGTGAGALPGPGDRRPHAVRRATVKAVAAQKHPDSPVAGQATVFVFPDLNTGNTTYKAVQRSANVVSVGPMLQGLRKPVKADLRLARRARRRGRHRVHHRADRDPGGAIVAFLVRPRQAQRRRNLDVLAEEGHRLRVTEVEHEAIRAAHAHVLVQGVRVVCGGGGPRRPAKRAAQNRGPALATVVPCPHSPYPGSTSSIAMPN